MSDVSHLSSASTVKNSTANISLAEKLIKGLEIIPETWSLTPVDGNKAPIRTSWNSEEKLTREKIIQIINRNSKCKGYGIRTGSYSGGILAVDCDGQIAHDYFLEILKTEIPKTVSFTSGTPGKCEYLFKVNKNDWDYIQSTTKKLNATYIQGENKDGSNKNKESALELRWEAKTGKAIQSVLPPSVHPVTGEYVWVNSPVHCEIATIPNELLHFMMADKLDSDIIKCDEEAIARGALPLYNFLSREHRKAIDNGVNEGGRSNMACSLARDLVGLVNKFNTKDFGFTELTPDPRIYFDQFCERCTPPYDEGDREWNGALNKKDCTPTLIDPILINLHASHLKTTKFGNSKKSQKVKIDNNSNNTEKIESYLEMAKRLLEDGSPESEVRALMGSQYPVFLALKKEYDQQFERESVLTGLPTLLKAQDARLSAKTVLYGDKGVLADIMTTMAGRMGAPVEFLITTFLAVAGSRVGTSSTLMIDPSTNRKASSIFWTCVVADTGKKKTPAQGIIIDPLAMLESESFLAHKEAIAQHKLDLQKYKFRLKESGGDPNMRNDKGGVEETSEPEPPKRRRYIVTNITNETKLRIHSENPRGLLHHKDEWIGFTDAQNKYRGGKGDDSSSDLSEFNGSYITKDVMDDERAIFIKQTSISKTGNTQFDVLKRLQSKEGFEDFSGSLARWLFCLIPARKAYADLFSKDDGSNLILQETLRELYIKLGNLLDFQYKLSDDAKRAYEPIERMLVDAADEESHPGLKATYPKLITYLERFALLLHVVNNVLAGKTPGEFVSGFTMQQACKMAEFYLAQARILYALNGEENSVSGELLKIKDAIAKYPEGISIRDLRQKVRAMRALSTETVKNGCEALIEANAVESADGKYFVVS